MKKICTAIVTALFTASLLVNYGYAFFVYNNSSATADINYSTSNALFDMADNSNYYQVYFFASPYYATGAEIDGVTLTDPLRIAESTDNPYNSTEEYMLVGKELGKVGNQKYANVAFPNGSDPSNANYHYISYKSRNENIPLGSYNAFERFEKRDYSGYIRENKGLRIEKTSTYVSMTVQGNITLEQLEGVVADTEFKDNYGFGPEFIGWTYDKEATAERTMYGSERYTTGTATERMTVGDTRGWGINATPYQIGNFGSQGTIEQVSSTTSLKAIDKTDKDGSLVDDRVIYLYPVFVSKNYQKYDNVGGERTPVVKLRVNPDNAKDEDNSNIYKYQYNQSYEKDYEQNRYTNCFSQRILNDNKNNVNYYTENFYIDSSIDIQLDICPATADGWGGYWTTVLSAEQMKTIVPDGYYDIDITLVQIGRSYDGAYYDETVNSIIEQYEATERYVKIYSSLQDAGQNGTGIVKLPYQQNTSVYAYYVIGFHRVEEFHLVGDGLNGDINDFYASGYKNLYTTHQMGEEMLYIVENVYLKKNGLVTVYGESSAEGDISSRPAIVPMNSERLNKINSQFADNGIEFTNVTFDSADTSLINIADNKLSVAETNSYTLIFYVEYKQGKAVEISVAYMRGGYKYSFVVLREKPTNTTVYVRNEDLELVTLVRCDLVVNTYLNSNTVLSKGITGNITEDNSSFAKLFSNYAGKRLIDSATGVELTQELLESGEFCLNRNYIVYFE